MTFDAPESITSASTARSPRNVVLTPQFQAWASAQGFSDEAMMFLDFLSVNNTEASHLQRAQVDEAAALLQDSEKSSDVSKAKPKSPTQPSPASPAPDAKAMSASTAANVADTERDEFDDMWTMSATDVTADDIKALMNLPSPVNPQAMLGMNNPISGTAGQGFYKSLPVSKGLEAMLAKAYKTQKPLRIDIADNASIILRLGKDGRVSAEFLPSDLVAEQYFRQNMADLKNRLAAKDLPVGDLLVRSYKERDGQQQSSSQQQSDSESTP